MRAAHWLAVGVLLSSCGGGDGGGRSAPEVEVNDGRGQFRLLWRQSGGEMSSFLQPAIDGEVVCVVSRRGRASFFGLSDGATARPDFQMAAGAEITGGVGCRDRLVAIAGGDGEIAVYRDDGEKLWSRQTHSRVFAVPQIEDGRLYVLDLDSRLSAYSARRGDLLWRSIPPTRNLLRTPVDSSPLLVGRRIFAGVDNGVLFAVDKSNGKLLWRRATSTVESINPVRHITEMTAPAAAFGAVCAAAYQGDISCLRRDNGRVLWRAPLSAVRRVQVDADGVRVFAADVDGVISAFDARDGELLWRSEVLKGGTIGALAFLPGAVIVGYSSGRLLALGAGDGRPLAKIDLPSVGDIIFLRALGDDGMLGLSLEGGVFRAEWRL